MWTPTTPFRSSYMPVTKQTTIRESSANTTPSPDCKGSSRLGKTRMRNSFGSCWREVRQVFFHWRCKRRSAPACANAENGVQGRNLQIWVLQLLLERYPAELTEIDLVEQLMPHSDDPNTHANLEQAASELAAGGLLRFQGPLLLPTRAALHIRYLELHRTSPDD